MEDKIKKLIQGALKDIGGEDFGPESVEVALEHPADLNYGDYSTNVAMIYFAKERKELGRKNINLTSSFDSGDYDWPNPKACAESIKEKILENKPNFLEKVEVAGAGFINFHLSQEFFKHRVEDILNNQEFSNNTLFPGKKIMIEYTDPNPFKPLHIGHLMTNAIGESIARILENSGAEVSRANYQGDVGLHVAKAIFGLLENKELRDESTPVALQAENIGKAYVIGTEAYTTNKHEIDEINKKVYSHSDEKINEIYDWGLKVTMNAFEDVYDMLGTQFDFYFLESLMAPIGENVVRENIGKVFEESDDAIVFKAEKHDPKLHTRVFITSQGLPTYETKELGLAEEKFKIKPDTDLSIVVTAREQEEYMKVVAKALSLIHPEYENKMKHITHGMMRFAEGKMSSRKGNVITGEMLIKDTKALVNEKMKDKKFGYDENAKIVSDVAVAAIKYSILKQSTSGDIVYDFEKSISFEGDSGPYLQYSYARANSVLEKAKIENILPDPHISLPEITEVEKLLYRFPEVALRAAEEYAPHYIANYLIELARSFNSFYGNNVIVNKDDETSAYKVALTFAFSFVMKKGLHLLGIEAPARM